MFKTFAIAAAATLALTSAAAADSAFTFNNTVDGSTAELGQVRAASAGTISLYDFHGGAQGALLGMQDIAAGPNYDVRVPLGVRPINDVIAVLTIDGQVVDTQELDIN